MHYFPQWPSLWHVGHGLKAACGMCITHREPQKHLVHKWDYEASGGLLDYGFELLTVIEKLGVLGLLNVWPYQMMTLVGVSIEPVTRSFFTCPNSGNSTTPRVWNSLEWLNCQWLHQTLHHHNKLQQVYNAAQCSTLNPDFPMTWAIACCSWTEMLKCTWMPLTGILNKSPKSLLRNARFSCWVSGHLMVILFVDGKRVAGGESDTNCTP